jgi:hypothetical protein
MKRLLTVFAAFAALSSGRAVAWDSYGAIAISSTTGAYGMSWGKLTAFDAQLRARLHCAMPDCFVAVTVMNGCASVASGFAGRYGWAIRGNAWLASSAAMVNCALLTTGCTTRATVCSLPF